MGIRNFTWEGLGIPSKILPAPPPFLPVPRGLVMQIDGLEEWTVYALRPPNIMEEVGVVYGETKREAEEAAENRFRGPGILALQVERA